MTWAAASSLRAAERTHSTGSLLSCVSSARASGALASSPREHPALAGATALDHRAHERVRDGQPALHQSDERVGDELLVRAMGVVNLAVELVDERDHREERASWS